jgi:hypothetical protein
MKVITETGREVRLHGDSYYWSAGSFASLCVENGLRALERFKGRCCWCGLLWDEHQNPEKDFRMRGTRGAP